MHEAISKGSRSGVGSLTRAWASYGLNSGKWSSAPFLRPPGSNKLTNEPALSQAHDRKASEAFTALQKGQEWGIECFFKCYYRPLSYFAYKLLEDTAQAEEFAAEAFVKLWEHRATLSSATGIKAWLFRTVRNGCLDHLRAARRLRIGRTGLEAAANVAEASALHHLIETEMVQQILATLETLPNGSREIFRLFYLEDKNLKEIAEELKVSVSTVKSQKARALELLRSKLPYLSLILLLLL
ncbi:MAG: RNA polymerase sigma-70 factor [Proteobacteria bacterium]|nr:MAG: RNA polymerase sigma-70 factor [Pseudomonadota bacterium]